MDYILIKAEGLPSTTVTASAFSLLGPAPIVLKFTGITKTAGGQMIVHIFMDRQIEVRYAE